MLDLAGDLAALLDQAGDGVGPFYGLGVHLDSPGLSRKILMGSRCGA
jgi:hypothetical protein